MSAPPRYRFAFDIGGTFTDLVLAGTDGSVRTAKVLSDQDDVIAPIRAGLEDILGRDGIKPAQVSAVIAGATTAVTNLVIERKGARTGLIATAGFRDVIEIARELRYDLYDLAAPGPDPIVPRTLRRELHERVDHTGSVLESPSDEEIAAVVRGLERDGVQAIAVSLLHSFANPTHEQRVRAIAQRIAPAICVSLSSEVLGEIREYERTVATVLNAYVMPMVGPYLGRIEAGLRAIGIDAVLRIMQSNGGVISREFGERMPIRMLESGPAAGALGAAFAARAAGTPNIVAFDMGGTTAKACLIVDGRPSVTTDFEAARLQRFKKGSGLPVRLPTVDLIEIGAGGGSIAHIDATGLLKVGPRSAGSKPGPACYGLGGTEPTVTDAALALGYLDPQGVLSGAVRLHPDLAEQAIARRVGSPLGLSVVDAAYGIYRIVCEHMAAAAKIHAVENGKDIRRSTLLAFGGAGPIHAREVARRTGCHEILVPANAGVFSAVGLLVAPLKVDMVRTRYTRLAEIDWTGIEALLVDMEEALRRELATAGVERHAMQVRRSADMRYVGQGFEVETELPASFVTPCTAQVEANFRAAYSAKFGRPLEGQQLEIINWRVEGFAPPPAANMTGESGPRSVHAESPGATRVRRAFFPEAGGFVTTPVLRESELQRGQWLKGPALIEQPGSTIVVGPGERFVRRDSGAIHIVLPKPESGAT